MDLGERKARWRTMFDNVRREDVTAWRDAYVRALRGGMAAEDGPHAEQPRPADPGFEARWPGELSPSEAAALADPDARPRHALRGPAGRA
jgi:trehalose 6-phosphate synthase